MQAWSSLWRTTANGWLDQLLLQLRSGKSLDVRRAGGFPAAILALMTYDRARVLPQIMQAFEGFNSRLMRVLSAKRSNSTTEPQPDSESTHSFEVLVRATVGCLHIAKLLVVDGKVGQSLDPHVPRMLEWSLAGLGDGVRGVPYSLRSAALSLFGALRSRMMAQKRVRGVMEGEGAGMQRVNKVMIVHVCAYI